jgi:hypothetical protein
MRRSSPASCIMCTYLDDVLLGKTELIVTFSTAHTTRSVGCVRWPYSLHCAILLYECTVCGGKRYES